MSQKINNLYDDPGKKPQKIVAPVPQPETAPVFSPVPPKSEDIASVLAYALRFSTTEGMRRHLASTAQKLPAEDRKKLEALLAVPDEQLRDAVGNCLNSK